MNKKFLTEVTIAGILILLIIYNLFFIPREVRIDKAKYPINGFDISKHTGKFDFKKFKSEYSGTIHFVYMKATEGATFIDKNFEINYKNARKNNIRIGAYHFFKFNKTGKSQAYNFVKSIKGKRLDLPLVLDVEEWGNFHKSNRDQVVNEIRKFVVVVEEKLHSKIIIYTNESSYSRYIEGNFSNRIWICSLNRKPEINGKWIFWQYSHRGKFPGAEGLVDLNTFNGSKEEWIKFIKNYKVYYNYFE